MKRLALVLSWVWLVSAQISCPGEWWYCLQREPSDSSLVRAVDTSSRSIVWDWETGQGSWNVKYTHSFTNGEYTVDACYKPTNGASTCFGFNPNTGWKGSPTPIVARAWDMSYNGDRFGFRPGQPQGRYTFNIFTRNTKYDPWVTSAPVVQQPVCVTTSDSRTEGAGWWLERKSPLKCPVTTTQTVLASPAEWSWDSGAGRWNVRYAWNKEEMNCTVYLLRDGKSTRLMEWNYHRPQLLLTYTASPVRVYKDDGWILTINNGEAWGFQLKEDGTWICPVYSRNVIMRPFEKPHGSFDLHQITIQ